MLCALLTVLVAPEFVADRTSMGVRLRRMESAWARATPAHKDAAIPHVNGAVMSFFGGRYGPASKALDAATLALGREPAPFDAWIEPVYAEPGAESRLRLTWPYPLDPGTLELRWSGGEQQVSVGENGEFAIRLPKAQRGVATLAVRWKFGSQQGLLDLRAGRDPSVPEWAERKGPFGQLILAGWQPLARLETDLLSPPGLLQELANENRASGSFLAAESGTVLRAQIPSRLSSPRTLVLLLHGAGGSEHMMFEGLGQGAMAKEAARRGWAAVAPRLGPSALQNSVAFARTKMGTIERVFVAGHSAGGAAALGSGALDPKPAAVALFAPAGRSVPASLAGVPVFVAVGKHEMAGLKAMASGMAGGPSVQFREYGQAEHLMIVAEAAKDAYAFFDRSARR